MSDLTSVIKDMSRQRKIQCVTGVTAVIGALLWLFRFTVFNFSLGEYIAALAIILFAVATIKRVDDQEQLEQSQEN